MSEQLLETVPIEIQAPIPYVDRGPSIGLISNTPDQVGEPRHVVVFGTGRNPDGEGLSEDGALRVFHGLLTYADLGLKEQGGKLIFTGDRSPADRNPGGKPEARLGKELALTPVLGRFVAMWYGPENVPTEGDILTEDKSIDTITNMAELEAGVLRAYPDEGVVGISQGEHLDRILEDVAPKIARRPVWGSVAPDGDVRNTSIAANPLLAKLFSRMMLRSVNTQKYDPDQLLTIVTQKVQRAWGRIIKGFDALAAVKGFASRFAKAAPAAQAVELTPVNE